MSKTRRVGPQVAAPFSMVDVQQWNDALAKCEDAMRQCEMAIQAGFPCQGERDACAALKEQLTKMKEVYAPGVP